MASRTLIRTEQALGNIVARPSAEVLKELQEIAASDPDSATPYLVMTVVSSFTHLDFAEGKRHLASAEKALKEGRGDGIEREFQTCLFNALQNEFGLLEQEVARSEEFDDAEWETRINAAVESRRAIEQMGKIARRIGGSQLPGFIHAVLRVHSRVNTRKGREYGLGMAALRRTFQGGTKMNNVAGFFLMYGYRRFENYRQAIQVGQILERRNPRSPLAKKTLGSAYHRIGNYDEAEKRFKAAISLAPNKPGNYLGYAQVLKDTGKLGAAEEMLEKAQSLDRQGKLAPMIENARRRLELTKKFLPSLKEIDWV